MTQSNNTDPFIECIECVNYGLDMLTSLESSTLLDIYASAIKNPPYTQELYDRYVKAREEVPPACKKVHQFINERMSRIAYNIPIADPCGDAPVIVDVPVDKSNDTLVVPVAIPAAPAEFNHKEFLRNMHTYPIEYALNIIKSHPDLFNTHYAEFMIYMYMGIKPKVFDINDYPILIPAMMCGVKKEFIDLRRSPGKLNSNALEKHYASYETDKFNVKTLMKDILIEGGFGKITTALAKSFFTCLELEEFAPATDSIDKYINSLHKNM